MLQQTQVATVIPRFELFLDRFPTLEALAAADPEAVAAAWSGLGYYRRARNLHASAAVLVREHAGRIPEDPSLLRELPGVGEYTAAALASLIHGAPRAVVDGNVIRVLTRLVALDRPPGRAATDREIRELAQALLEPAAAGDWNQAVMELGATVCLPRHPACDACPWRRECRARAEGTAESFPRRRPPAPVIEIQRALGVFRRGGRVLLRRRRDTRLLEGTWELPGVDAAPEEDALEPLVEELETMTGGPVRIGAELTRFRHSITRRRIAVAAFEAYAHPAPTARGKDRAWVGPATLENYPVSSMTAKVMRALASGRTSR